MSFKKPSLLLALVFAGYAFLASCTYLLMPATGPITSLLSYLLQPGVAMYVNVNGSLLFGAGFGSFGNYLVVALGSAAVWALLTVALVAAAPAVTRKGRT